MRSNRFCSVLSSSTQIWLQFLLVLCDKYLVTVGHSWLKLEILGHSWSQLVTKDFDWPIIDLGSMALLWPIDFLNATDGELKDFLFVRLSRKSA